MIQSVFEISRASTATRNARAAVVTWEKETGKAPSAIARSLEATDSDALTSWRSSAPLDCPEAIAPPLEFAPNRLGYRTNAPYEIAKHFRLQRLFTVTPRLLGIV